MKDPLWMILEEKGREVHRVSTDDTVVVAVKAMNDHGIGSILVMEDNVPVGIFTERDVLRRVVAEGRSPAATRVGEVMTSDVVVVSPTTTIEEAMAVVTQKRCRHLPVVDDDEVVGMVSIGDLTRWVTRGQVFELQQLTNYITDRYPA